VPSAVPKPGESLADLFPVVAAQWHPTKNGVLQPSDVSAGSPRKCWWACPEGLDHDWPANIESRTRAGTGCPFCANQRVSVTNSLESVAPHIAAQWHPKRNGDLTPSDVVATSARRCWWVCDKGPDHEWVTAVRKRTGDKTGCPCCAGKKASITNCLATLYPELAAEWDHQRNALSPVEVVAQSNKKYAWRCNVANDHRWEAPPGNRVAGRGCPFCAGRYVAKSNCLATMHPDLVAEWHPTKNDDLTPSDIYGQTTRKVWWLCSTDPKHEWPASPQKRAQGRGCPKCGRERTAQAKKVPKPGRSLLDVAPQAAAKWDHERNGSLTPDMVKPKSHQTVHWRCEMADDHRWSAPVSQMSEPLASGCPFCAGKRASSTNNLRDHGPAHLVDEWDAVANADLAPADVTLGSGKRVWWICPVAEDHKWRAVVASRVVGKGCRFCAPFSALASSTNNFRDHGPSAAVVQWDYSANGDLRPEEITLRSNKKVIWFCQVADDHRWQSTPSRRAKGEGCPFCIPKGGRASSTNNLRDHGSPHVVADWDYERNGELGPEDFPVNSGKRVAWRCSVVPEHRWTTAVDARTGKGRRGCPSCTLTPRSAQEMRLAHELSALIDFDLEVHKVRFAGRLRDVDIVLDALKVVVEFDGAYWHRNKVDKDREKTALMEEAGWQVIRVRERPLDSIHVNEVMVDTMAPAKTVADLVLNKIVELTGTDVPQLDEYLASEGPWREAEALKAIRAYQAERAAKKAARKERNAHRKDGSVAKAV